MNNTSTNLDQLHDIVLPTPVPWWPLAPGWYVVLVALLLAGAWILWRLWQRWLIDRYRREALSLLGRTQDAAAIVELLKRTALAIVPRKTIATMTPQQWVDWLQASSAVNMPEAVRDQLMNGVYCPEKKTDTLPPLRAYAAKWIAGHQRKRVATPRSD